MSSPIVILLLMGLAGSRDGEQISAAEVLDMWQAGVDLIRSYDLAIELVSQGYVTVEGGKARLLRSYELYPPSIFRSRIWRSGSKRRGEFGLKELDERSDSPTIINSDVRKYDSAHNEIVSVTIQGHLFAFGSLEYEDYEATYRTTLGTVERVALSRARRTTLKPREGRLYVLETPEAAEGDWAVARWRVWLDPKCNYLPVRTKQWFVKSGRTMLDREIENELAEVEPGVWAPVAATIRVFAKDPESPIFGKCMGTQRLTVVRDRSRFNVDLPDDLFERTIPVGATIVDRIRNITYKEGSTDPDAYLTHLAQSGNKAVVLLDQKGERLTVVPEERRVSLGWTLLTVLAVLGGCVAAVILSRRPVKAASN